MNSSERPAGVSLPLFFVVPGEPVSVNRSFVGGSKPFTKSPEMREFMERVAGFGWQARCAALREKAWPALSEKPCEVSIAFYYGSERPDADGPVKAILDSLQPPRARKPKRPGASIYLNDRQVVDYHVSRRVDRLNPRVEIEVVEVEGPADWVPLAATGNPGLRELANALDPGRRARKALQPAVRRYG